MATKQRGKRSFPSSNKSPVAGDEVLNLFVDAPPDGSGEDSDSTDSEESDYSGLEEEEETSDEEASDVESIEEGSSSDDGEEQDENGVEEASASDEDMEEEQISKDSEDSEDETNNNLFTPKPIQKKSKTKRKQKNSQKLDKKDNANKTNPVKNDNEPAAPSGSKRISSTKTGDEYDVDSSDEEDIRNTVGNIPMEWYKEFSHIGYDLDGKQIIKPKSADELDQFLDKMDNPNYWRTVKDKSTGQRVVLSDKDVDFIQRLKKGKYVDSTYNPYQGILHDVMRTWAINYVMVEQDFNMDFIPLTIRPWVDFFTHETMKHPLTNHPAQKRSFIPSLWEKQKVSKIVHAIKMGWMKPKPPATEEEEEHIYYNLWENDDQDDITKRLREHIPAPKMILPGHEESYNPPPEYLMTEEEKLIWKEQEKEERKLNFIPQKFSSLRQVPAFSRFINERFERCLDLYLCPRQRKMRMNVNPEDLLPKLPKPKDLQPFPTTQSVVYKGHEAMVRSISVDPTGQWLLSGCDDSTVKVWEVSTGRCLKTFQMGGTVRCVAWNPNPGLCLIAAIVENELILINPEVGDKLVLSNTDNMVNSYEEPEDDSKLSKLPVEWEEYDGDKQNDGFRLKIKHPKKCTSVVWHGRGDYLAVVLPEGESMSVLIHQVSQRRTQNPFRKPKGLVQSVVFHPTRPFFFVATQRYVRVYNLLKQELTKKLMTNVKWVSCMAVHPGGDNVIIGSYDCRAAWFDLDLSSKPYQTLRHHKKAIRQVCYHKRYPLFASASDDGTVIVCHGKVFSDLLQNPMIVPVKVLRGHTPTKDLGVLDCEFHPTQPWIFSSGSDHTIRLFT